MRKHRVFILILILLIPLSGSAYSNMASLSNSLFGRNKGAMPDFGVTEFLSGTKNSNQANSPGFWTPQQQETSSANMSNEIYNYEKNRTQGLGSNGSDVTPSVQQNTSSVSGSSRSGSSGSGSSGSGGNKTQDNSKLLKSIKNSFSSTINNYKNAINDLPGQQQDSMAQIGNLAGMQQQSITDSLNAALGKFTGYRGEVASNQKLTLQDLADNTRNLFQSGNNYLGALGAGNSSATGMYSAALTQQANKQRSGIQNQTNDQYNNLNIAEQDTKNQAQQSIDEVNTWRATQEQTIVSQYQDLKRQLQQAYAGANDMQKQAIAKMDQNLYQQAAASLSNIQSVASNFHSQLGNSLGQQSGKMGAYTGAVGDVANQAAGNVQQQTFDTQGMQIDPSQIEGGQSTADGYTGFYNGQKVASQDGITWYLVQ